MDYELPKQFDLIVVGTGMVESIVSAAASRVGKTVLHIDSNNYYGGLWASFNLDSIQKLGEHKQDSKDVDNTLVNDGEHVLLIGNNLFNLENFSCKWHIPEKCQSQPDESKQDTSEDADTSDEKKDEEKPDESKEVKKEGWTVEDLLQDARKFNIDLAPKLQFARGNFVELLISSNIARYSEFRSVSRVLTWLNGQLEVVPCSRSDVFANNKVSVIEKRMLMKLLTSLDTVESELEGCENKPFRQFLKEKKLTANLIHYVLYALSMSTDETMCIQGVNNTRRFLNSLGRFRKTPFLFSMYGSGEVPQQFCRLSAVFGGVYALSQPMNGFIFDDQDHFKSLVCGQQRIDAPHVVMGIEKAPDKLVKSIPKKYIARAVFITDKSLMDSEKEHLTLLLYPPEDGKNLITVIEMGTLTGTCPKDLFLVHLTSRQITNPREDFKHCVGNLFSSEDEDSLDNPHILWSCYFSIPDVSNVNLEPEISKNVFFCPGPDMDLDYDPMITAAQDIFNKLYPDMEFLPRAPDPEEIVIEGYDDQEEKCEGFSEKEGDGDAVCSRDDSMEEKNGTVTEKGDELGTKSENGAEKVDQKNGKDEE